MEDQFRNQEGVTPASGCFAACTKPEKGNRKSRSRRRPHYHDNDESEIALAKEMSQLSVQERERVLDEIHGVAPVQNETPEFVAKCIQELEEALLTMVSKNKRKALDRVILYRPGIVQDKKFKLMFLRADAYDGAKAAKRLALFFEIKLALFGEVKLAKKITLDDLEPEDLELLNVIGCVVLPHRDQTGRPILFFDMPRYDFDRLDSMFRCWWYQVMITIEEDETAQLKGVCDVAYCPGSLGKLPAPMSDMKKLVTRSDTLLAALPCRITTFHFCYDDPLMRTILNMIRFTLGKEIRLRIRAHYGSDLEMQYSLMTFGIHCHSLFRTTASEDERKEMQAHHIRHRRAIEKQQEQERKALEDQTGIVHYPEPNDVLLQRGRPYQMFPGNQRYGKIIDQHNDTYHKLANDRFAKTCLTMDIVKRIHEYGGRYLEKRSGIDGLGWTVVDDVVAREKTAVAFRSRVAKVNTFQSGPNKTPLNSDSNTISSQAKRLRYDPSVQQS